MLKDWLFIHNEEDRRAADDVLAAMQKAGERYGFKIEKPGFYEIKGKMDFKKIKDDIA